MLRNKNSATIRIGIQKMLCGSRAMNRLSSIGLIERANRPMQAASVLIASTATIAIGQ